jgi:hypothetical protein
MTWRPINTAPTSGQFLVTNWEPGDAWACTIELVNGPFLPDGRILNQNTGNYSNAGTWTYWMPLPPQPNVTAT